MNKINTEKKSGTYTSGLDVNKECSYLINENKELRENNNKLWEKKLELERRLMMIKGPKEKEDISSLREIIFTKEIATLKATEKLRIMEAESDAISMEIDTLEKLTKNEFNLEDFMKSKDTDHNKLFNEIVIKNINKRDQLKSNNKMLLENLINLGKEHKQLRGSIKK